MQSKQTTKDKWKIEVFIKKFDEDYGHALKVFYSKERVAEFGIYSKTKTKLDPYMWFEAYEAVCYHKPSMSLEEWQDIIRELDNVK